MAVYTTIDNPELYFQIKLYTGNGSSRSITFDGEEDMQPNLLWGKQRAVNQDHVLVDSIRGTDEQIYSSDSSAAQDNASGVTSFDSNGFSLGSSGYFNNNTNTFVAWCWKASGSTASNTNGTNITSTVDANTTSGFSIVSWTGDNSGSSTVGHGLGKTAEFVAIKNRADSANWQVKHKKNSANASQSLDTADAESSRVGSTNGGIADLSGTTTFGFIAGSAGVPAGNGASDAMIAYVWNSVQGFSKFGSYEGNNNANGSFIYTGFSVAWVMVKNIDTGSTKWVIQDSKRSSSSGGNPADKRLKPNDNTSEETDSAIDLLSNGFKIRSTGSWTSDADTFVYAAFAEAPFVNSNGVPCNAR